jgi:DNA primase
LPATFSSNNRRAVQVRNKATLPAFIRNKGISGDIFSLIAYINFQVETFDEVKDHLYEIKHWIYETLGWKQFSGADEITENKKDYNSWLKKIKRNRRFKKGEVKSNKVISSNNLKRYGCFPHYLFRKGGILWSTQKEFGIGFDLYSNRITYPVHNKFGDLIGVKGRIVGEDNLEAGIQKYIYLIPCDKSIELFNLHRAMKFIKEKNEVLVFESAKSVMLAYQYSYKNAISIEGNEISKQQAILLKELNCKIVLCFDKDMTKEHIVKQSKQIKNRLCYAIIDDNTYLEGKMSPVDRGKTIWNELYQKHKYKIV